MPELVSAIIGVLIAIVVVTIMLRSVRVIRQQQVGVVERLGKFPGTRSAPPGAHHRLRPVHDGHA
jgi:regulator of protease activity HflC (stomatin/prohibitin superfamily)